MASITFTFTQSNGNATGWGNVGVTLPQVVSNKLSTPSTGTTYGGSYASGLTLTTYAEITVDFDIASGGEANVWLIDGSFNGYGGGWGSASGVRIQRLDAGAPTNIDTDGHLAGGSGTHAFKFTRTSAGLMKLYVDGVEYCSATDTTYSTPATILITYSAVASVAGMDNLVVSDTAGAVADYIAPRIIVRRQAVQRAGSW